MFNVLKNTRVLETLAGEEELAEIMMNHSQQNKNTQPTTSQTKKTGGAHDGGQQFEIKMAALIGLRGLKRGDKFKLATNVKGVSKFNDLVYTTNDRRYFLELKHSDIPEENKWTKGDLETLLEQCFLSFCDIKYGGSYKDVLIDKTEFIIYTNRELGPELLKHGRQQTNIDMILKTSAKGEIFNFTPDENKKIDVYTLVENIVTKSNKLKRLEVPEQDRPLMHCDFLKKLIMATGQKGHRELDDLIENEIIIHVAGQDKREQYKSILNHLKPSLENWWREREYEMSKEILTDWLQIATEEHYTLLVKLLFKSCMKGIVGTGIKFSNSEISWLQAELSNKRAVHVRSDALTLCSKLLLDCLPQSKCIFVSIECLQSHTHELLHAWLGGVWKWLIVSCDATVGERHISDTCLNISKNIKHAPLNKCVIILSMFQQVKEIIDMQAFIPFIHFIPINHRFKFEQLSKESQAMVLDKKIDFQGYEVTMRSVLERHGNVEHVLGPQLVTDLITDGTAVNIGGKLHVNTGYYAPRVLERNMKVWLQSNVLRNPNDVIAVSGTTEEKVLKYLPSNKTVEFVSPKTDFTHDMSSRIFLLPDKDVKDSFLAICKKLEGKPLHWVEFNNGCLLWKMSQGDTDSLLDYVDAEKTRADKRIIAECMKSGSCEVNEDEIWDLDVSTVLVVAEPGMGKSSTTTHVAWKKKDGDHTYWVVRINWNDHTRKLQEMNAAKFNFDTLVEFLCSAAFSDSKYTDINSSLLKQALQSSGDVTVLMDGFDEISPTYEKKAALILTELKKTKTAIWITSRPVVRERLESQLCVRAFNLKKLSHDSQEIIFRDIWKLKTNGNENDRLLNEYIECIRSQPNKSIYLRNLTGCPLHIRMIACDFKGNLDKFLRSEKLDLFYVYHTIVDSKLHIYEREKKKEDITNASVKDDHKRLKETYVKNLEKCSLLVTVPSEVNSLHDETIRPTIQPFIKKVQDGKDKIGIVMSVVEGKPQFVHRTFAEYFTARWFSKNFQSNRSVLKRIIFDPPHEFVRNVFDRILAKGCPLHCAVLDGDVEDVENQLQKGSDVNARDAGGRTVMHLIAAEGSKGYIYEDITYTLLQHTASLDAKDYVLQWTPLQYAKRTKNDFMMKWLQENMQKN